MRAQKLLVSSSKKKCWPKVWHAVGKVWIALLLEVSGGCGDVGEESYLVAHAAQPFLIWTTSCCSLIRQQEEIQEEKKAVDGRVKEATARESP
jgi:hypothetical protein